MNLLFRLVWVIILALRAKTKDLFAESALTFRVWPNDLDLNAHMNNGRYLTIMDLGRVHLMGQGGLLKPVIRQRWGVAVGNATIRFRRPLRPFQKYRLKTQLLGWDAKWFYLRQTFEMMDGTLAAKAVMRGLFVAKGRSVPSEEALHLIPGWDGRTSPTLPTDVVSLQFEPPG